MKALFIFAHPDDETFATGGIIRKLANHHVEVDLITATNGENGLWGNLQIKSKDELGVERVKEQSQAGQLLGISRIYHLAYPDGGLQNIDQLELTDKILNFMDTQKPDLVFSFDDKIGGSNHPDHIAVAKATTAAFKKYSTTLEKPVWLYYVVTPQSNVKKYQEKGLGYNAFGEVIGTPDEEITTVVDISKEYPIKEKAFHCHQTQIIDVNRFLERARHFDTKHEYFKLRLANKLPAF